jgi:hypothetical protein
MAIPATVIPAQAGIQDSSLVLNPWMIQSYYYSDRTQAPACFRGAGQKEVDMSKRNEFIARMKAQLDEWSAELHRLEAKAESAEADVGDRFRHAVEGLREKKAAAEAKLEELRDAGEDSWEDHRGETERTWTAFKASLAVLRDFSDHA